MEMFFYSAGIFYFVIVYFIYLFTSFHYLYFFIIILFLYYFIIFFIIYLFIYQEPTDIPSRKKLMRWVCARGLVCQKREFTARSSSCEVMIRS